MSAGVCFPFILPAMSDRYEMILSCFMRNDSPESALSTLRWHLGLARDCPEDLDEDDHPWQLLIPSPQSRLPGGDAAVLRESERLDEQGLPLWELFARNYWVDDNLLYVDTLLEVLAPHIAFPGYGGHLRHEFDTEPVVFVFRNGEYTQVPPDRAG